MPLYCSTPSRGFSHSSRLSVNNSPSGFHSFKTSSSKIPARRMVISSTLPSGITFRPKSGVPSTLLGLFHCLQCKVQTTVGTEIIPNVLPTIRRLGDCFRTARDRHIGGFGDIGEGIGCPGKLATVAAVAQALDDIRWIHEEYDQTALADVRGWPVYSMRILPQKQLPTAIVMSEGAGSRSG